MSTHHYDGLETWAISIYPEPVIIKHGGHAWTADGFTASAPLPGKTVFLVEFTPETWNTRRTKPPFESRQWLAVDHRGKVLAHHRDQVEALKRISH
jgi:hypothetical protein